MMTLTKYGLPQVAIYPLATLAIIIIVFVFRGIMPIWLFRAIEAVLIVVLLWELSFFRDPSRKVPAGSDFLISPADGKITSAEVIEDRRFEGGKAFRISIFLSVFNVHINRMPAKCVVEDITYKPGKFINAMDPECSKVNEANEVTVKMLEKPGYKLIIRQVSGAIARRIVCRAAVGDIFDCGSQFGMIKFGSCTELYLPAADGYKCMVKPGDKVKAGLTKLVVFEQQE